MQNHHIFEPDGSLLREAVSSDLKSRSYVGQQRIFELPLIVRGILDMESRLPVRRASGWFGGSVTQRVFWICPGGGGGGRIDSYYDFVSSSLFSHLQKTGIREDMTYP